VLTGHAVMTPARTVLVLVLVTNDFLSMWLAADRASPARAPSVWRMRTITAAAVAMRVCKLGFSTAVLAFAKFRLALDQGEMQTLAFVALVAAAAAFALILDQIELPVMPVFKVV
jgi:H+-transporting ATPase